MSNEAMKEELRNNRWFIVTINGLVSFVLGFFIYFILDFSFKLSSEWSKIASVLFAIAIMIEYNFYIVSD